MAGIGRLWRAAQKRGRLEEREGIVRRNTTQYYVCNVLLLCIIMYVDVGSTTQLGEGSSKEREAGAETKPRGDENHQLLRDDRA